MWQTILAYAVSIGFPNANHYGNDLGGGIAFGSGYDGTLSEGVAQEGVLRCAQTNGYPAAVLFGDPPMGVSFSA